MGFLRRGKKKSKATQEKEDLAFIDHIDELRSCLIRALLYSLVCILICAVFSNFLVNNVLLLPMLSIEPYAKLQNLIPYGQVSLYIQTVLFFGLVLAFPIIAHQVWKFLEPALTQKERSSIKFTVFFLSICFFLGIAFGYFVVLPVSLRFLSSFGSPHIENNIAIGDYMSFFMGIMITTGIMFELPFASYILSKIGVLTPAFMRRFRRYAIVIIIIVAAAATPSTDAVTMGVVSIPMLLLYEVSIAISSSVEKKANQTRR